jgi:hypothetical protein
MPTQVVAQEEDGEYTEGEEGGGHLAAELRM